MDTSFFPILYAVPKRITATVPEWKALLKLLPPCEEVLPLFKKIADGARFFTYDRLLHDYRGARLPIVCSAFNRNVGGTCEFNVGQRAALTFVLFAYPKAFTTPQKKIVSAVLLNAEEICDPVNALIYDLAANSDPKRARDIGLDALLSARQLYDDINAFWKSSND
ncbi:hypothetical protein [Duodenibacillus massiliensis]|jgi:hypothetical protein|uniref:hypothetical protein n=1 Tax=Duodenibacillus massiliensis TaxID=1852381 RepID=UPI002FDAC5B4